MLNIYAMQLRRLAQGTLLFSSQINNLLEKKKMEIQNIISSVKGTSQPTEHLCHRGFVPLQRVYKYLGPKTMALLSFRLCWLGQAGKTWRNLELSWETALAPWTPGRENSSTRNCLPTGLGSWGPGEAVMSQQMILP